MAWSHVLNKLTYVFKTTKVSSSNLNDIQDAVIELQNVENNNDLFFSGVTVSATTGNIVNLSDNRITTNHVLARCEFANNAAITALTSWSTNTAGKITISGTCTSATTAEILLIKKDN